MSEEPKGKFGPSEYLFYRLIQRMKSSDKPSQISKTRLYKYSCEADHYLEEDLQTVITFPRYWYRYGEIPKFDWFDLPFITITEKNGFNIIEFTRRVENNEFDISDDVQNAIDQTVSFIVSKFRDKETEEVLDLHYEHRAPREFIREFNSFRENLEVADLDHGTPVKYLSISGPDDTKTPLKNQLKQLVIAYPDLYESMETAFLEWEDTMQILIEENELEAAQKLAGDFWTALSRAELRIHHNKDISKSQIDEWKSDRPRIVDGILESIRNIRKKVITDASINEELQSKEATKEFTDLLGEPTIEADKTE